MAGKSPARKQSEEKIAELDRERGKARVAVVGGLGEKYAKLLEASQEAELRRKEYLDLRSAALADSIFTEEELADLGWPDLTPAGKPKRSSRAARAAGPQTPRPEPAADPSPSAAEFTWTGQGGEPQQQHTEDQRIEEYA